LGEVLKQTYARVDKANKEITLTAGEAAANSEAIAALQINVDSISSSVKSVEGGLADSMESINGSLNALTKEVATKVTPEALSVEIRKEMANGVSKVETATGFTFDENGLKVSKTGTEITTQISEDGMRVYRNEEEMLRANNEGVKATNLHANTYLIIGTNSRFEDYGDNRTGCFWIGG
jgi:predicted  nucleic acid-binding Zn-ribbon protein